MSHRNPVIPSLAILLLASACSDEAEVFKNTNAALVEHVGDPCVPEDEAYADWAGLQVNEITINDRQPECGHGYCVSYQFRGRVLCPDGNDPTSESGPTCTTTQGDPVTVTVPPHLPSRPPEDAVICSCRCDGPPGTGPFCACPDGFSCEHLVDDLLGNEISLAYAGSYCVRP